MLRRKNNSEAIKELFNNYPELKDDLYGVYFSYLDEDVGVAIYRNHLIIFNKGIKVIYIGNIYSMNYQVSNRKRYFSSLTKDHSLIIKNTRGKTKIYALKKVKNKSINITGLFNAMVQINPAIVFSSE